MSWAILLRLRDRRVKKIAGLAGRGPGDSGHNIFDVSLYQFPEASNFTRR